MRWRWLLIFLLFGSVEAQVVPTTVTPDCVLGWNANTEPTLDGYRIFTSRFSGAYTSPTLEVGAAVTSTTCPALNLTQGIYYLQVRAIDDATPTPGESTPSNEIALVVVLLVYRGCVLGWNANTEPNLGGYRIYVSQVLGSYGPHRLQVGAGVTSATCAALGLTQGIYHVQVTAIDNTATPLESSPSTELSVNVRVPVHYGDGMPLTPEQLDILHDDILADPVLSQVPQGPDGAFEIAAAYNLPASPSYIVWRTSVTVPVLMQEPGFDWTRIDNLTVGKARIWDFMTSANVLDPSKPNVRAGFQATFSAAGDQGVRQALYIGASRAATRAEKLFSTGTGTPPTVDGVGPGNLTFEGALTYTDVEQARNLP